jgi:hypothetical protein
MSSSIWKTVISKIIGCLETFFQKIKTNCIITYSIKHFKPLSPLNYIGFDEKREFIKDNLSEHWLGNRFIGLRLNYILFCFSPQRLTNCGAYNETK